MKIPLEKKIVDLDTLAARVKELKRKGKRVVHCHGVFDLLHVGHIRHFSEARGMGDALVVTLTPDEFVNKGPHRPAFTHGLRAEMLAALDSVDYVAVNRWPNAEQTIRLIKPSFYVKGPDYKVSTDDITGGIKKEEEAVRAVGGKIRFTEDITFSSTALVNQHLSLLFPNVKDYVEQFRRRHTVGDIKEYLQSLKGLKVLVVGETILDDYIYCDALGKSSKEPILAMRQLSYEMFAGGILAIANHVADFCSEVEVLTYLGKINSQEEFVRSHLKPGVKLSCVYKSASPTILKRRYVENYLLSKLFEVYQMNDELLEGAEEQEFCQLLEARLPKYDVVIVADYGHGLMTPKAIQLVSKKAKFLAVNTQINAANIGFHTVSKYPSADYICIHEGEIRLEHRSRKGDLKTMVEGLAKKMAASKIMVTRGKTGTLVYDKKQYSECPAFATKVVDRIGAGDAVLALTSLCAAKKVPGDVIGFLGNLVGAQAVMIVGNRSAIDRVQLIKSMESFLK
jgi:rfaE bifunctional protein kinase chain/domain/rfaE bifunctional protein nucleotidyltransferase chain/domain